MSGDRDIFCLKLARNPCLGYTAQPIRLADVRYANNLRVRSSTG